MGWGKSVEWEGRRGGGEKGREWIARCTDLARVTACLGITLHWEEVDRGDGGGGEEGG